jgi:hypothetical protein
MLWCVEDEPFEEYTIVEDLQDSELFSEFVEGKCRCFRTATYYGEYPK